MKISFNPSNSNKNILDLIKNNKDIIFDLKGHNIFARGVKFCGTDTWRDIKINNVSIGSNTLDLRNGSNTTLTNTNGVVTINSTWRPVVDNLTSDSTTSSLSAKQGKVLAGLINGKSDSGHNHDGRYLRLNGSDTMQGNLYLHSYGTSYIGKGSGDKSGADFTEANIVIRSWWGISFKSHDDIVRTYIDTRTGNIGTKGVLNAVGAVIQGRVYNDGDDEGIIIKPASNGYAGLILGAHNSERSVFYLTKGNPFWRYNNGSANLDIKHPKKSGTIALTSDIPSSLKNPYSLTLQANGTTLATYDGSVSKIVNLTYDNVGAAAKNHTHNSLEPWASYSYITGDSHATALKSIFDKNKSSIPRNKFISMLSRAYDNTSYYMGYFIKGYDNNPFGGFFVAHYDTAYYIGISNGSFSQHRLVYSTDIPNSLKNPHALTISLNGTSQGSYDGSAAKNINITPGSIGAATSEHNHDNRYLKLTGGTMQLGEGLKFHANDNYFGTNSDARIISLLDNNDKICDGGLIIDERCTSDGKEYVTELLRIRDSEFKWKGSNILHSGNSNINGNTITINGSSITVSKSDHTHAYLPLSGGNISGTVSIRKDLSGNLNDWIQKQHNGPLEVGRASNTMCVAIGVTDDNYGYIQTKGQGITTPGNLVLLPGGGNLYKGNINNVIWHAGNDGANSGLDADLLDGEHGSRYTKALGGSNYITINVGGDANTYYPVVISSVSDYYPMQFVNISRVFNETAPDTWNTSTHKGGLTLTLLWNGSRYWDGNSSGYACYCVYKNESYSTMVGGLGNATGGKVVWLRGGGAAYHIHSMNGTSTSVTVYTSTYTDGANHSFSPRTTPEVISVRWPGMAQGADYATSASSADSATKIIVNQHTTNNTNYPLVWSNQNNTNNVTENQLYKSWSDLYYNPKNKRLTVGGSVVASSFVKSGGTSQQLLRADGGIATFNWSGQSGQPTWLWGGNNQHSYYVYNPSNFRVAYASSAGNADTLDGLDSTKFLRQVVAPNNTENDFNTFSNMTLTGRVDPTTGASLKNAPWSGSGPAGGYGVLTYLFNGWDYGTQMAWEYGSNRIYIRNKHWGGSGVGTVWRTSWDKLALTTDIPSSLKNPHALTLKANGTTLAIYDGSSAKEANFTYANVGAAPFSHTHTAIVAEDLRAKYPGQILDPQRMKLSFLSASTLGIKNDGSYYDVITVRSYADSSGGADNALLFSKNSNSLYHTRFAFGSTSSWGSPLLIIDSGNIGSQSVAYASKAGSVAWGNITGKPSSFTPAAHDHNYVLDIANNSHTTFAYSKPGLSKDSITWLAVWNGYELRAMNKDQIALSGHTHDDRYLKLTGGTMTGNISYKGSKNTYEMIRFIDNNTDVYGNGICIGGGGLTIIGGGDSASEVLKQHTYGGNEKMIIANDAAIDFFSNIDSGWNSRKAGSFDTSGYWNGVGFKKNNSSDSYVLLGGGGHKALSDFSISGHTHSSITIPVCSSLDKNSDIFGVEYAGGSNSVATKPSGVDAFGVIRLRTAEGWYGQIMMSANTAPGIYYRNANGLSSSVGWKKLLDSSNFNSYSPKLDGTGASGTWNISITGNANTVDNIHATGFLRWKGMQNIGNNAPFQAVVDIIKDTSKLNDGGLSFYSYVGDEYTVLIGSRNDATRHGNALKWGYANKYLWMIRMINGSPRSSDWEKISAGYADSAGSVAWSNITGKPSSLKNPYSLNVFGVAYDGSVAKTVTTSTFVSQLEEDTSTVTDGTMFITSYASNSGFADTNAVNVPYKRKASCLWNYIDSKVSSKYLPLAGGTMNAGARISHDNGNLYIGRVDNYGWVYTQDIASQKGTDKWSIRESGAAHFGALYIASKTDNSFNSSVIECNSTINLNYFSSQNVSLCNGGGTVQIGSYTTGDTGNNKLYVNGSEFINGASNVKNHVFADGFRHRSHNSNDSVLLAGGGYSQGVPVRYWAIYYMYIGSSSTDVTYTKRSGNYDFITSKEWDSEGVVLLNISFPSGYNKNNTLIFGNGDHRTSSSWKTPVYVTITTSPQFGWESKIRVMISDDASLNTGFANIYFMCMG